ncbi:MAG TPA: hypothetical protein VEC75_04295, partial [Stellaceae bacterium]|nr:hypothetical protein [Stellaceae bacterium]
RRALRHLDASEGVLSAADGRKVRPRQTAARATEEAPRKLPKLPRLQPGRRRGTGRRGGKSRKN